MHYPIKEQIIFRASIEIRITRLPYHYNEVVPKLQELANKHTKVHGAWSSDLRKFILMISGRVEDRPKILELLNSAPGMIKSHPKRGKGEPK